VRERRLASRAVLRSSAREHYAKAFVGLTAAPTAIPAAAGGAGAAVGEKTVNKASAVPVPTAAATDSGAGEQPSSIDAEAELSSSYASAWIPSSLRALAGAPPA
jgi:hypothetical protein